MEVVQVVGLLEVINKCAESYTVIYALWLLIGSLLEIARVFIVIVFAFTLPML